MTRCPPQEGIAVKTMDRIVGGTEQKSAATVVLINGDKSKSTDTVPSSSSSSSSASKKRFNYDTSSTVTSSAEELEQQVPEAELITGDIVDNDINDLVQSGGFLAEDSEMEDVNINEDEDKENMVENFIQVKPPSSSYLYQDSKDSCLSILSPKSTVIALPAPSPQIGNAYGGNQSYLSNISDSILSSSLPENYYDTGGGESGSSTATVPNTLTLTLNRSPGDVGLPNVGNSCFMNAGLQCLIHTPPLVSFFLKNRQISGISPPPLSLVTQFQALMKYAWSGTVLTTNVQEFKNVLGNLHVQFKDGRQHDCQEFLALMLDTLHEQLKKWKLKLDYKGDSSSRDNRITYPPSRQLPETTITSSKNSEIKEVEEEQFDVVNSPPKLSTTSTKDKDSSKFRFPVLATSSTTTDSSSPSSSKTPKLKTYEKLVSSSSEGPKKRKRTTDDDDSASSSSDITSTNLKEVDNFQEEEDENKMSSSTHSSHNNMIDEDLENVSSTNSSDFDHPTIADTVKSRSRVTSCENSQTSSSSNSRNNAVSSSPSRNNQLMEVDQESQSLASSSTNKRRRRRSESARRTAEKAKGEMYWNNHIAANDTVIAETFQGMYKSTVRCSVCGFVSVTYEPFMYLSLPIPSTIKEQIFSVTYISMLKDRRPVKVEVNLSIMDSVSKLKTEAATLLVSEGADPFKADQYVIAEVANHYIFRILTDKVQMKSINDNNRNIYMFELNDNFDELFNSSSGSPYECNNSPASSNIFSTQVDTLDGNDVSSTTQSQMNPRTYLDDWERETAPMSIVPDVTSSTTPAPSSSSSASCSVQGENISSSTSNIPVPTTSASNTPTVTIKDSTLGLGGGSTSSTAIGPEISYDMDMEIKSGDYVQCTICLEDYRKTEMKQHYNCSCTLCQECIKKSASHFDSSEEHKEKSGKGTLLKCAVCGDIVEHEKVFIPLGMKADAMYSSKLLHVPILFRNDPTPDANNNSSLTPSRLFGYPWLIKIPSKLPASELHEFLKNINPFPQANCQYLTTSWEGKYCAKCRFDLHCRGCVIPQEGVVSISTRNCIVISYSDLSPEMLSTFEPSDMAFNVTSCNFSSMWSWNRRDEPTIDIHDCLRAFSEIEHLDEQNPWYCPECTKNQCATKTLSVCRFPDYLIVYLKRFVFLDHSSNKLNNRLTFPISDFNVGDYIAEEFTGAEYKYDLYACVCHFGTASSGHYTAYGKNPNSAMWHYFNDERVTSQRPEQEFSSAFVLFYERQGVKHDIPKSWTRPIPPLSSLYTGPTGSSPNKPVGVISPSSTLTSKSMSQDGMLATTNSTDEVTTATTPSPQRMSYRAAALNNSTSTTTTTTTSSSNIETTKTNPYDFVEDDGMDSGIEEPFSSKRKSGLGLRGHVLNKSVSKSSDDEVFVDDEQENKSPKSSRFDTLHSIDSSYTPTPAPRNHHRPLTSRILTKSKLADSDN